MSRAEQGATRLAVAFNKLVQSGYADRLPEDLAGDAISRMVLAHEAAAVGHRGVSGSESDSVARAEQIHHDTERLLTRVRHAVLAAFDDAEAAEVVALGPLGVGPNQGENGLRLAHLATALKPLVTAGKVALVADLQPDRLAAHAAAHAEVNKVRVGVTADRQVDSGSLEKARKVTHRTLQRVKNFVKSFRGPEALTEYGFGVPLPPSRPRLLRGEPADAGTAAQPSAGSSTGGGSTASGTPGSP